MSSASEWFEGRTRAAPPVLRARARAYLEAGDAERVGAEDGTGKPTTAHALAAAGAAALASVTSHCGDRSAALDLLAADALITLALLEQAERDPGGLGEFAADLLRRHGQAT